jgi:hypothetical protein
MRGPACTDGPADPRAGIVPFASLVSRVGARTAPRELMEVA